MSTAPVMPGGYRIEANRIVGEDKIVLPKVCAKCGDQSLETLQNKRRIKELYWVHPAVYILLFCQLLIFLIVYMVLRKKCRVEYSLCPNCTSKVRMNWLYVTIAVAVLAGGIVAAISLESGWPLVIFFLGLFGLIYFLVCANGPIQVSTYKNKKFYLRGACPEFLFAAQGNGDDTPPISAILAEDGRMS